jgi:putative holliday junction resolvase
VGPGRYLGIDFGTERVGLAVSDPDRALATPLQTVIRRGGALNLICDELSSVIVERNISGVVVGYPRSLSGVPGKAALAVRNFAELLAGRNPSVPVRLVDERFTTVVASHALRASGVTSRKGRTVIDQVAAMVILQNAMDAERCTGLPIGELVVSA